VKIEAGTKDCINWFQFLPVYLWWVDEGISSSNAFFYE
jgi:hypothetical protein